MDMECINFDGEICMNTQSRCYGSYCEFCEYYEYYMGGE